MKTALDLLHGVRVELAGHSKLPFPSSLRHQYIDLLLLKSTPVQQMKRRSRPASPCPCVVAGTAKDSQRMSCCRRRSLPRSMQITTTRTHLKVLSQSCICNRSCRRNHCPAI
jgi:hypothetical protein